MPSPRSSCRAHLASLAVFLFACGREAPPRPSATSRATVAPSALPFSVEPAPRGDGRVERVARFRVPATEVGGDEAALVLVRGEIGPSQLRQLATGAVSRALRDRIVAATTWRVGDDVALQPSVALEPGSAYALASGPARLAVSFAVVDEVDAAPMARRLWPLAERSGAAGLAVWCGAGPLPAFARAASIAPPGIAASLRGGAVTDALGPRCVRLLPALRPPSDAVLVGPPAIDLGDAIVLLDPAPLVDDGAAPIGDALACDPDEARFGPGCAQVEDDRVRVRAPAEPLLWAIAGEGVDVVAAAEAGGAFVVAPLEPERAIRLAVGVLDVAGGERVTTFEATTGPPRPHLVLNEALADPLGDEPEQEWVELVNDGRVPGRLAGHALADAGEAVPLPDVEVAPGEHVLLVAEGFSSSQGVDVPPAPGTRLVRLPRLAAGGLKNTGEEVRLLAPDGRVVSALPATPAPKPGRSIARTRPSAPDAPGSFSLADPTPGKGNGL